MKESKFSNNNFQAYKVAADESTDAEGVAKISAFILGWTPILLHLKNHWN
jgi:hypothetical protein